MSLEAEQASLSLVLEKIESAFGRLPRPDKSALVVGSSLEGEEICNKFRGRHWRDLDASDLAGEADALCFFTPEALQFFFPAFIRVALVDPQKADLIPDVLLSSLVEYDRRQFWGDDLAARKKRARTLGLPEYLIQSVMNGEPKTGFTIGPVWDLFNGPQKEAVLAFIRFLKHWRGEEFTPGELECIEKALQEAS